MKQREGFFMVFVLIALAAIINLVFYRKKIYINTGSMAVVMTLGIINFGILHLPINHSLINTVGSGENPGKRKNMKRGWPDADC